MFILGIIPARGDSRGIPNKNIYPLCGKPMIEYTIEAAEESMLDDWLVFTDKYFQYKNYGITEPKEFAYSSSWKIEFSQYCVNEYEKKYNKVDAVMLLQPTSPLRTAEDINKAIAYFKKYQYSGWNSLYSGYNMRIKHKEKLDSKENGDFHFQRNGAIFITKIDLLNKGKLWDKVIEYQMPKSRSIDVDDMDDFYIVESILKNPRRS
ncbi:MAG: acylneuraminate cytidylyltransferase family protein [Deltaproteobacteria bacterium]|nr:acylneuraminate cytidylyltransferase family protein [Deltaproteobacteria bacterium]